MLISALKLLVRKCYSLTKPTSPSGESDESNLVWTPLPQLVDPVYKTKDVVLTCHSADIPFDLCSRKGSSLEESEEPSKDSSQLGLTSVDEESSLCSSSPELPSCGNSSHLENYLNEVAACAPASSDPESVTPSSESDGEAELEFCPPRLPPNFKDLFRADLAGPPLVAIVNVDTPAQHIHRQDLLVFCS